MILWEETLWESVYLLRLTVLQILWVYADDVFEEVERGLEIRNTSGSFWDFTFSVTFWKRR